MISYPVIVFESVDVPQMTMTDQAYTISSYYEPLAEVSLKVSMRYL